MYNELYHTGVFGMRWGVRRYQNKDGTLTKEGLRRKKAMSRYQQKINYMDKKATTYVSKHDFADKKIVRMQRKLKRKGANNVSVRFDNKLAKLINKREKYSDVVKTIDKRIKKTAAKILKNGYNIRIDDVAKMYRNPNRLSKSPAWGHSYTLTESDKKRGTVSSYSGQNGMNHVLGNESKKRRFI